MKNIPEKIYLQIDADGETPEDFNDLLVSWCKDKIYDTDIEYVLPSAVTGGMKWVKASERLPLEPGDYCVKIYFSTHIGNGCVDFNGEEFDNYNVVEWLDESPSPTPAPQEGKDEK